MTDERSNAIYVMVFILAFNLSIILVGSTGLFPATADSENDRNPLSDPVGNMLDVKNWDWTSLVMTGTGLFTFIGVVVFRMPIGAAVFSVTFGIMSPFVTTTLNTLELAPYYLHPAIGDLIFTIVTLSFLVAFIRFSSN